MERVLNAGRGFNGVILSQQGENPRLARERLDYARQIYKGGADTFSELQRLLVDLSSRIGVSSGSAYVSVEQDRLVAQYGNDPSAVSFTKRQEALLFSGRPIREHGRYIHPIKSEGFVIGLLCFAMPPDKCVPLVRELVHAYSLLMKQELELKHRHCELAARSARLEEERSEMERTWKYCRNILQITAHDLASPLSAVVGYLEMIGNNLDKEGDANAIKGYYEHVQTGIHNVCEILDQVREVANNGKGGITAASVKVDLNYVVSEVCKLFDGTAKQKGIQLCVEQANGPIYVNADVIKLRRVVSNLVSNALNFSEEGSRVDVKTEGAGSQARIYVKDRGIGIARDKLEDIFEPYVRLEDGGNSSSQGLGLFISSYLMKMMNGSVHVNSEPGAGSRFTIEMPWVQ